MDSTCRSVRLTAQGDAQGACIARAEARPLRVLVRVGAGSVAGGRALISFDGVGDVYDGTVSSNAYELDVGDKEEFVIAPRQSLYASGSVDNVILSVHVSEILFQGPGAA